MQPPGFTIKRAKDELPPSPMEREILERMAADTRRRLNAVYAKAFREVVELVKRKIGIELPEWGFVKDDGGHLSSR